MGTYYSEVSDIPYTEFHKDDGDVHIYPDNASTFADEVFWDDLTDAILNDVKNVFSQAAVSQYARDRGSSDTDPRLPRLLVTVRINFDGSEVAPEARTITGAVKATMASIPFT